MNAADHTWPKPPRDLAVRAAEVHVWRSSLAADPQRFREMEALLSAAEHERARGFTLELPRRRFVLARGELRTILGLYLGCHATAVELTIGPFGKPCLAEASGTDLRFNLAHSHLVAVFAVTVGTEVGVDVEHRRARPVKDALVERFFSPGECREFRSFSASERQRAFCDGWARKEAFLKARGLGLSAPLRDFEVSLQPDCSALRSILGSVAAAKEWTIADLPMGAEYSAALAIERTGFATRHFERQP